MGIKPTILQALLACILIFTGCATAQNYPQRSKGGDDYYVYKVQPGNTLFAISRRFSVGVSDLIDANPGASDGLSIGEEVLVPLDAVDKRSARKSEIDLKGNYLYHTVQRKETLFSISRDYGVNLDTLRAINSVVAENLSTGAEIRIPTNQSEKTTAEYLEPARNDTFLVHQVQKGETAFGLAKKYDIPLDSLNRANDSFKSGMDVGQYIVIPKFKPAYKDSLKSKLPAEEVPESRYYPNEKKEQYQIGLMLPFELAYNDSLDRSLRKGDDLYLLTEIALEYYRGTLMALDSLKKLGLNAKVKVYDVGEDIVRAKDATNGSEIAETDLIFGPMHKTSLAIVSDATRKNGTYLVSPNSFANEVFEDNRYLLRAEASQETMMRYLANYVAIQHEKDNVLMINSETPGDWPLRKLFIKNYNLAAATFSNVIADSIRSITKDDMKPDNLAEWLKEDVSNVLVVPSKELAYVSDLMTKLSRIDKERYDIQIYGLANWIRFENIDAEYKNRFKLRLAVPSYIDYDSENIRVFLRNYRERYNMEPSEYGYGFLGYDLTMFFGKALLHHGLGFPNSFFTTEMEGLGANYRFGKSTTGKEFENKSVYIIEYDDFDIKRVN